MIWAFDRFHEGSINDGQFGLSDLRVVQTQAILHLELIKSRIRHTTT